MSKQPTLAIMAGGGPAPGINSVIGAATIEAHNLGWKVLGIYEGYAGLMNGGRVEPLTLNQVAKIHFEGGSILGTSRTNPAKRPEDLMEACANLKKHGIDMLLTIGGDDTSSGAVALAAKAEGLRIVHMPKTIDNDLPLPGNRPTFGYETARHYGVLQLQALMEDARTTNRWFIVTCMGRTAGHLALGIARASGSSLAIIPEEFNGRRVPLQEVKDIIEASVLKQLAAGIGWGVAVVAEGVIEQLDKEDLDRLGADIPRDDFGHIRLGEIDLGRMLCKRLESNLQDRGIKKRFIDIKIGYELRCANPIPFDIDYTRDLASAAVQYLNNGGSHAIMSLSSGMPNPLRFEDVRDPETGRIRTRRVNIHSESYRTARRFMRRLTHQDLDSAEEVAKIAETAGCSPEDFTSRFGYLVENEPRSYSWNDDVRNAIDHLISR